MARQAGVDEGGGRLIPCPFHALTGLDCPGCGLTRATFFVLDGDIASALRHNVLLLPVGLWLAAWYLHRVLPAPPAWLTRLTVPIGQRSERARIALGVVVIAFTLVRNVPGPDAWLAPPA